MTGLGLNDTRIGPRHWWPADATFAIDFTSGLAMRNRVICPLAEAMSLTRPSAKLARDSAGRWHSFAANVPAITDLGLSIEPERTNLVLANTANAGPGLVSVGTTRTNLAAGDSPALDGHGKLVTQGGGGSDALYFGPFTNLITAGSTHAVSACFKYAGSTRYLRMVLSDNISVVRECWIDLVDRLIGNISPGSTARLVELADGWLHIELTAGPFPTTTPNAQLGVVSALAMGDPARLPGSYKMWGGQTEKDQVSATSPILTFGTAGARAADHVTLALPTGGQSMRIDSADNSTQTFAVAGGNYSVPPNLLSVPVHRIIATA